MRALGNILARLEVESLTPPMTAALLTSGKYHAKNGASDARWLRHRRSSESLYGQLLDNDPDLNDPRWELLMREYFVEHNDPDSDDLLFFVRRLDATQGRSSDGRAHQHSKDSLHHLSAPLAQGLVPDNDAEPVFVKRRQTRPNAMPHLEANQIFWKETFFLNLIVQVPVKLIVAVCKRTVETDSATSRRSSMTQTSRRVSRNVYAMPTKSSVDEKERAWECSWPLIYYAVEDCEEAFEQLVVREGEYLCVELSTTVPSATTAARRSDNNATRGSRATGAEDALSALNGQRSTHDGTNIGSKVTLFQGAASFAALMDTYQRKATAKTSRRFRLGGSNDTPMTELIMMRGPGGKGHAQVAITGYSTQESAPTQYLATESSSPTSEYRPQSSLDAERPASPAGPYARPNSAASFFQSLKRMAFNDHPDPPVYDGMQCRMMLVNVPWTSIIADLMGAWQHAAEKRAQSASRRPGAA